MFDIKRESVGVCVGMWAGGRVVCNEAKEPLGQSRGQAVTYEAAREAVEMHEQAGRGISYGAGVTKVEERVSAGWTRAQEIERERDITDEMSEG